MLVSPRLLLNNQSFRLTMLVGFSIAWHQWVCWVVWHYGHAHRALKLQVFLSTIPYRLVNIPAIGYTNFEVTQFWRSSFGVWLPTWIPIEMLHWNICIFTLPLELGLDSSVAYDVFYSSCIIMFVYCELIRGYIWFDGRSWRWNKRCAACCQPPRLFSTLLFL